MKKSSLYELMIHDLSVFFHLDDNSGNRIRVIEKYVPLNFLKRIKIVQILGKFCGAVSRKLS